MSVKPWRMPVSMHSVSTVKEAIDVSVPLASSWDMIKEHAWIPGEVLVIPMSVEGSVPCHPMG